MHVEEQRYTPLSAGCVVSPGAFPWSKSSTTNKEWWEQWDTDDHRFVFHIDYEDIGFAGTYIKRACTEFASGYEQTWLPVSNDVGTLNLYADHGFGDGKPGRMIDIDMNVLNPQQPYNAVFVPNWGPSARWWRWGLGTGDGLWNQVMQGKAYGDWAADGKKKQLVSLTRRPSSEGAHFAFVINELKPGETQNRFKWGMKAELVDPFIRGKAWGTHPADNVKKRLISAKRYGPGSWTILYAPTDPENAYGGWYWEAPWQKIAQHCADHNKRVIYLERYADTDNYTAVLLKNM